MRKGTGLKEIVAREPVCLHVLMTFTWDSKGLEKEKLSWGKKYHSTPYFVKTGQKNIHHSKGKKHQHLALRHWFCFAVTLKCRTLSCFRKSVWIVYSTSVLWTHKPRVTCCAVVASTLPSPFKSPVQILKYWCEFRGNFLPWEKREGEDQTFPLLLYVAKHCFSKWNAGMEATSSFGWLEEERPNDGASIVWSKQQQVEKQETNALFFPFPFWIFFWI